MEQLIPLGTLGVMMLGALIVLPLSLRICQEWERGVILRLGKYVEVRGPGLILLIPLLDRMVTVDLRVMVMEVTAQEVITRDNVTIKVNAVVFLRVVNPRDVVIQVEGYRKAVSQFSQTSLRTIIGQSELDEILIHRDDINRRLQRIIDEATEPWGVKVTAVEIKDVELPTAMQRAMARQAEAEREKRAKVIHAEGEFLAAARLAEAAELLDRPAALQLRYLQTLVEISVEKSSTVVFPVPIDTLHAFVGGLSANRHQQNGEPTSVRSSQDAEGETLTVR
ncbi:MAG: slipin family protein [Armatimonadetes bacterium]|nr:slipin family protein [Armatimonadota bacterium]